MMQFIDYYKRIKDLYKTDCVFCKVPDRLIIKKTANFTALLDIAPLTEGHTLISSHEHIGCVGDIPDEIFDEFADFKNEIALLIKAKYGPLISFEHGRAGFCIPSPKEARLCHHFHIHLLPCEADISPDLNRDFYEIEVENMHKVKEQYELYNEYLFFENSKGKKFFYPMNKEIPTHYLRTLISNSLSVPEYADWMKHDKPDILLRACKSLCFPEADRLMNVSLDKV